MATRVVLTLLIVLASVVRAWPQGSAGSSASLETRSLIDQPTAGMISHGSLAFDIDFYQSGGMLLGASVGLFDRILVGMSFGGAGIIGSESPRWNEVPGLAIKLRALEEGASLPALAIGFNSQGKEEYIDHLNRYTIKSPGLYLVVSKNYEAMGFLGLHAGMNFSLERGDGDEDVNIYFGAEKTVGSIISLLGEYNLGLNDSNGDAVGRGRGYVNLGLRASMGGGLSLGLNFKDIIRNQQTASFANRTVYLEYVRPL